MRREDLLTNLERFQPLPSQKRLIDAYNDPKVSILVFTGANQVGKSKVLTANLLATVHGYEPWTGRPRPHQPPVQIALLLDDYENAANKWLNQNLSEFYPIFPEDGFVHIKRNQQGAPREITFLKSLDGSRNGSVVHIFTQDQESRRAAGGTYHEFYMDEPQPKTHFIEIARGLQRYHGKSVLTMTPLSEPWIFDDLYNQAGNLGGIRPEIFAITAFPDENLISNGGHLDDNAVKEYRASMSEEEREARVHGRWMHLIGRVYKEFDENIHVIDELPEGGVEVGTPGISVDPHDRLPFFISWFYVTPSNDFIFYDEWPDEPFENFFSSPVNSYDEYVEIFNRNPSTWRVMDPNFGRKPTLGGERRGLTVADEFALRGFGFLTDLNDDIESGHKAISQLLHYDRSRPIDALNAPKIYFKRKCRNLITSMRNYTWDDWRGKTGEGKTPKQTPREKYKHGSDTIRYAKMAGCKYIGPGRRLGTLERPRSPYGWQISPRQRERILTKTHRSIRY